MGLRVRTYCPVGDLVAGMSYLVRRLLENTSNDSFLLSRSRGDDLDRSSPRHDTFINEPLLELRRAPVREQLSTPSRRSTPQLPLARAGARRRRAPRRADARLGRPRRRPSASSRTHRRDRRRRRRRRARRRPGRARLGGARRRTPAPRSSSRAAGELRSAAPPLAALAVRECAKPWAEADADVCEAIDFLEYYAQQAVALEGGNGLVQLPGERNTLRYAARGVVAVIGPWNFPLAIPAGMVAAGLATGNGVVLKPAEQSPACALAIVEAFHAAGVPAGALNLLPGEGDVGAALVAHPGVHTIAFTGSGAVGLEILQTAAELAPGQRHLKRVVAEMGGKNCVIVDADADLDDVVPALVYSRLRLRGPEVLGRRPRARPRPVADTLIERLHGAVDPLLIDQAQRFGVDVPPVIEPAAQERIEGFIADRPRARARASSSRGTAPPEHGHFVAPAVIDGLPAGSRVTEEEIFGPVLAVERGASIDEACEIVARSTVRAHRRPVLPRPRTVERVSARAAGRQPLRQPPHHRRDGRPPAVRRQPAVRHRHEGGRRRTTCCSSSSRAW